METRVSNMSKLSAKSDIGERLIRFATSKGFTAISRFEDYAELPNGYVCKAKTITKPRQRQLSTVCPDLNMSWVLSGDGEMLNHSVVVQPMGIKERVLSVADTKGIEPSSLEGILGVSGNYFRNTESVSAEPLAKLITIYPDINADWLLTGRGSMFRAEPSSSPWESLVKAVAEELKKTSEPNE